MSISRIIAEKQGEEKQCHGKKKTISWLFLSHIFPDILHGNVGSNLFPT
jgi:hypothetical protein